MLRYLANEPIYPICYVKFKIPKNKNSNAEVNQVDELKAKLIRQPLCGRSIEYADNPISLYSVQKGKCAVTGESFTSTAEIHCHHKIPKSQGGTDEYLNLILVTITIHKLIHTIEAETIKNYLKICKSDMKKLNVLRKLVGNTILSVF